MTSPVRLVVRTEPIEPPASLLAAVPRIGTGDYFAWIRDGEGFVGWGRAASVRTSGASRFDDARAWWQEVRAHTTVEDHVGLPGCGLLAFGSFAYAAGSESGAALVVPQVIVGHRAGMWWRTRVGVVQADGTVTYAHTVAAACPPEHPHAPGATTFEHGALSPEAYGRAVSTAVDHINAGEVEKVVLARDEVVRTAYPIDARWLLGRLANDYPRTWVFSVDGLIGATPEMLVRLERGLVTSRVLAGTIRRTGDDSVDLALAARLARSSKDLEEHDYAVRSVAEALAPYCTSMNVPDSPFVLHLPNVMHLATDVAGRLANGADSLRLAASLHPSAAVCGTPRRTADALITELEGFDRDRYAGPVGWIDASGDGEWGIALRSGRIDPADPRSMRLYAGCGIVAGSEPTDEIAESNAKLMPMKNAFNQA